MRGVALNRGLYSELIPSIWSFILRYGCKTDGDDDDGGDGDCGG